MAIQSFLYYLIDFKNKLNNPDTLIPELINKNVLKELNMDELKSLISNLRKIQGDTFKTYSSSFFRMLLSENNSVKRALIPFIKEEKINSNESLCAYLLDELFGNYTDDDKSSENISKVENFLNLDILYFNNWYNYVSDKCSEDIKYHTYHGTKGDEFDNELIIMENDFGRNKKDFFSNLITNLSNSSENDTPKIKEARNLFYVAVTRAKYNLAILYTGVLNDEQKHQISDIFGEIDEVSFQY